MPGRVPWERLGGDDVEAVISMLILRQHPHGHRIRPTQGDGGVDVLVPTSDNHWDVYQIKRYATTLTSGHKTKITNSWRKIQDYTQRNNITLNAWYVVRPIDPTHVDRDWLANLTTDVDCPTQWIGLTTVDNWSADYPQVIDYFLDNNSQHVLDTAEKLLRAASLTRDTGVGQIVEPAEALDVIGALAGSLNTIDPHYKYQLTAYPAPRSGEFQTQPRIPGSVFTQAIMKDGTIAQLDIIARYDEAPRDRPLPLRLNVNLEPTSDEERQRVADFLAYGIPFDRIPVQVVNAELPGGATAVDLQSVAVSVFHDNPTAAKRFDLIVRDGETVVGAMELRLNPLTQGLDGRGRLAWGGEDISGVIAIMLRIDPGEQTANISLTSRNISGANPASAAQALDTVVAMRQGFDVALHIPGGPVVLSIGTLSRDAIDDDSHHDYTNRRDLCCALIALQTKIPREITIPDLSIVDNDQVQDWVDAATLLRGGELTGTWSSLGFVRTNPHEEITLPSWVRVTEALTVDLLGNTWTVGYVHRIGRAMSWTPVDEQARQGILSPGPDTQMREILAPGPDADNKAKLGMVAFAPIVEEPTTPGST